MDLVVCCLILFLIGVSLAIKVWILIQAIICIGTMMYIVRSTEGLEGIPFVVMWLAFSFGMVCGDIYYYINFYHGGAHIVDVFSWLFKP